jgi:hypothetical protein
VRQLPAASQCKVEQARVRCRQRAGFCLKMLGRGAASKPQHAQVLTRSEWGAKGLPLQAKLQSRPFVAQLGPPDGIHIAGGLYRQSCSPTAQAPRVHPGAELGSWALLAQDHSHCTEGRLP